MRRAFVVGSLVWAVVGAGIALSALFVGDFERRALVIVTAASILGPLAAVGAAWCFRRGDNRRAGALLLVSVLTPTYFAAVVNVPALVVGLAEVIRPCSKEPLSPTATS